MRQDNCGDYRLSDYEENERKKRLAEQVRSEKTSKRQLSMFEQFGSRKLLGHDQPTLD